MTQEQHALIKKAHESLDAARLLLEEGFAGFAAARAYYTMLYLAQAFLLERALSFSKHSAVIAAFGKEFVKTDILPKEFHRYLIDAQEMRLIADYQGTPLDAKEAAMQIDRAEEFLRLAEKRLAEQ